MLRRLVILLGGALILFGLAAAVKPTQPFFYFLSPDGHIGESAKLLMRVVGVIAAIAGGVVMAVGYNLKMIQHLIKSLFYYALNISAVRWIILVFLLAVSIRILWVFYCPALPYSDFAWYDEKAWEIARGLGMGYPESTAFRPPGYPLFLAMMYKVFGHRFLPVKMVQVLLGGSLCLITYALIREIAGESVARVASLATVLYPTLVFTTSLLASENLFTPLFVLTIYLFIKSYNSDSLGCLIFSGLLMGGCCLIRSVVSLLPAFFILWALIDRKYSLRKTLIAGAIFVFSFLVVTFPWQLRNYRIFGSWGIIGTSVGTMVYDNNTPWGEVPSSESLRQQWMEEGDNEYEVSRRLLRRGLSYIRAHPGFYFKLLFKWKYPFFLLWPPEWLSEYNLIRTYRNISYKNVVYHLMLLLSGGGYYLALVTFLIGIFIGRGLSRFNYLFLLVIFYQLLVILFANGVPRYRHPLLPLYLYFSSVTVVELLRKIFNLPGRVLNRR